MFITYKILVGDDFKIISRKKYGTDIYSSNIEFANPGVREPLTPGTTINIPELKENAKDIDMGITESAIDEITIKIDGEIFRYWNNMSVYKSIDSMDSYGFTAPFELENENIKRIFKPLSYKDVNIGLGNEPLLTGTMINVVPGMNARERILRISGYSRPGVLNDCNAPSTLFPIEYNDMNLKEITESLIKAFGLELEIRTEMGARYERVAIETSDKILEFLIRLAVQRNIIISNTEDGKILYWRSVEPGRPVAIFNEGEAPFVGMTMNVNNQQYYSHVTGIEPMVAGLDGAKHTLKNDLLSGVFRPHTFDIPDTLDADLEKAVNAKMGRMFGNVLGYNMLLSTWRDSNGNLWAPNTTVKVIAPGNMIYNEYELLIRSVEYIKSSKKKSAILGLVLPGSFEGKIPERLPWEV